MNWNYVNSKISAEKKIYDYFIYGVMDAKMLLPAATFRTFAGMMSWTLNRIYYLLYDRNSREKKLHFIFSMRFNVTIPLLGSHWFVVVQRIESTHVSLHDASVNVHHSSHTKLLVHAWVCLYINQHRRRHSNETQSKKLSIPAQTNKQKNNIPLASENLCLKYKLLTIVFDVFFPATYEEEKSWTTFTYLPNATTNRIGRNNVFFLYWFCTMSFIAQSAQIFSIIHLDENRKALIIMIRKFNFPSILIEKVILLHFAFSERILV